jgi:lipopolysaccharide export system protein LptA
MKKQLILLSLFMLMGSLVDVFAQSRVQIILSDKVVATQTPEGLVRKLTGNVHLRTNDMEVRSDTVFHYVDLQELHGFSNLRIDTEKETIWADKVVYDVEAEIASLSGNVIIETTTASIYSETALYSFLTEIAFFNNPIWLQDEKGTMRAESGVYFNQVDSAAFRGNVQVIDSTQYIEADSLFTNRSSEYYELHGTVYLQDDENRTRLMGDYVEADSTGRRRIDGNAVLRRINEALTDTTWLTAGHINITKIDTFNIIDALDNVEIWEIDYASRSDSSRYNEQTELFELRRSPIVWYNKVQLNGEIIDIQFENDTLKTLLSLGNPFAVQLDSLTDRLHQMKGDTIKVLFEDDTIDKIFINANAEMLLHYTDDDDNPDGAINIRGERIVIYFEDGDVADMTAHTGVDGETFPESPDLATKHLEGFAWNPDLRPQRPSIELIPRLDELPMVPPFTRPEAVFGLRRLGEAAKPPPSSE